MKMRAPALLLVCAALCGCTLSTTKPDMGVAVPSAWKNAIPATDPVGEQWWREFGSAELENIVRIARHESLDIAASRARVRQAQALARIAGAPLFPEVDASFSVRHDDYVKDSAEPLGTYYSTALTIRYEVDFWGGNRAAEAAAVSRLQASEFDNDALILSVSSAAAQLWLQGGGLRDRITISESNLANTERVLDMVLSRHRAGAASALEVAQQRGLVAAQRRLLAALRQRANESDAAMAVLLGRSVEQLRPAATLSALRIPTAAAGVPSELLVRRPDIARAEAQLTAADADIVVARAAMLPKLTLSAGVASLTNHSSNIFGSSVYSLAAALALPIFSGGRLEGQRDLAQALQEEALADYRLSIITAFGEVEIALSAVAGLDEQRRAQEEEVVQARRAFELAESRYKAGADTLLTLLDAQRTLYEAQEAAAELHMLRLQASVVLYKALGGGWTS